MAQIGTIRLETQNNGTVSVPVFDTGDSGSGVYEFVRVQTAGGTGFIPVVDPADANFPYLRVQSQNQGVVAVHNETALKTIVDNYEDANLNEYRILQGGSDEIGINSSIAYEGDHCLESVNNQTRGGVRIASQPGDGLPNYPSDGDTIQIAVRWGDRGNNPLFAWCVDASDSYTGPSLLADIRNPGSEQLIGGHFNLDGGGQTDTDITNLPSISTDTWYLYEIDWNGDTYTATMKETNGTELGTVSWSYSTNGNGIGYRIGKGMTWFTDDIQIL